MRIRGIEEQHELSPQLLLRDTRTLWMKIKDFFKDPLQSAMLMAFFAGLTYIFPAITELIFLLTSFIYIYAVTRPNNLPFRMPQRSGAKDYTDTIPGSNNPRKARGICFFGNHRFTNEELWFNNDDMRTHVLIFGSTGSGKTEALVSLAFNALTQASGFLYVDGKGDNSLFAKVFSMCRSMGREDDLLLINFMTGAKDIVGAQEKRLSNTMNPFCNGSSSMLSQLVVSLMDSSSQSADGDMWKGRAIVFVEALMKVLVYARDKGKLLLDANTIRNYFELTRIEAIVIDRMLPRNNQEPASLDDAPEIVLEPLSNYIINLPGYDRSKKGKQSSQVLEQHGFITMQLTRVFGSLADTYGHIIRTNLAEVDLKDVVLNRRILVVLLPALEKSPDELSTLGKVIIASLKAMMAAGLGEAVEGSYREVIARKPTTSLTPYICILDEYGYYAVKGFAVVPAQARSLGFSVIFAGQDLPAFQKASKEEAMSIGANTNIKICMKLEDPLETWDFFQKTAGETYVTKVDSFQANSGSLLNNYMDARSASSEKRQRIDLLDLKDQREGEAHIFFKSKIIRARMFFANPKLAKLMQLNQFLKVEPPSDRLISELEERIERFRGAFASGAVQYGQVEPIPEIDKIISLWIVDQNENGIDRGLSALMNYHGESGAKADDVDMLEAEDEEGHISIFAAPHLSELTKELINSSQLSEFAEPIVPKTMAKKTINFVERYLNRNAAQASSMTQDVIRDMTQSTDYPPDVSDIFLGVDEVVEFADQFDSYLQELIKASQESD